jgi:hypothetical protein
LKTAEYQCKEGKKEPRKEGRKEGRKERGCPAYLVRRFFFMELFQNLFF